MNEVNLDLLKEKINIVQYIGQYIELQYDNKEWWGLCPFHDEKTPSFDVSEEKGTYYCHGCKVGGSVIDFASKFHKLSLSQAIERLSCEYKISRNSIPSIMRISKKFKPKICGSRICKPLEYIQNPMDKYIDEPIKEWIAEGINQEILKKYEVRYDRYDNRIVFPIKNNEGEFICVKGRTLDADYKSKKNVRKYTYYGKIGTIYFFFGFYENCENIATKNEIIIFEGEKSVMKLDGFGINNSVASLTSALTDEQIESLIKFPCRDVIIAWDKGVLKKQVLEQVKKLKKYKNVYFLNDKTNLLGEKDSPIDKGIEIFQELYKNKERIF